MIDPHCYERIASREPAGEDRFERVARRLREHREILAMLPKRDRQFYRRRPITALAARCLVNDYQRNAAHLKAIGAAVPPRRKFSRITVEAAAYGTRGARAVMANERARLGHA